MQFSVRITNLRIQFDPRSVIDLTPAHQAMALRMQEMVRGNFGSYGLCRPATWPPLSKEYSKKIGSTVATLYRRGTLYRNVFASWGMNKGTVTAPGVIAAAHEQGTNRLPSRPVFPFLNGRPTQFAQQEMQKAAHDALS